MLTDYDRVVFVVRARYDLIETFVDGDVLDPVVVRLPSNETHLFQCFIQIHARHLSYYQH